MNLMDWISLLHHYMTYDALPPGQLSRYPVYEDSENPSNQYHDMTLDNMPDINPKEGNTWMPSDMRELRNWR